MRKALDVIHHVATDGGHVSGDVSPSTTVNGDSGISLSQHQPTAFKALKEFEVWIHIFHLELDSMIIIIIIINQTFQHAP